MANHARSWSSLPSTILPFRPNRARYALERALDHLTYQEPGRIDRTRHGYLATRHALKSGLAVIGLVAHQQDQAMAFGFGLCKRALDQHLPDATVAKRRLGPEPA